MAIELTRLTAAQRNEVLRDLARKGLYPAAMGDRAELEKGGSGASRVLLRVAC